MSNQLLYRSKKLKLKEEIKTESKFQFPGDKNLVPE